ncbi:NAD(P)-dependent oxidoreductase [Streptomyces sp. PKU-MA01144]|uniref:NAD(P)-dependent oxidoreductase n=1 Tax=Streptomyces TaxID=1883 RepID=UPI00147AF00B|nr:MULTISPECIES: NAD(P)-dependent oxidoreductase [Streptomyces]MCY0985408.1 NAD(P)-dependent oxidoreductase [Streptomyces tirandamycinicus]NNJ07154.1 NAD(P)-dependent oxidoreductase [Streptomyces sp. PKU-MA01144]
MTYTTNGPVAVLGLGTMGAGLASRLLGQGIQVRVWNRTPERAEPFARAGAFAASRPSEAVEGTSAAICTVADGEALRTVLRGPDGILARGDYPGALICASTVAPDEVVRLAGDAPAVLDVGMLGNRDHARDGELRLFVGGEERVFAAGRPLLEMLAKEVVHLGALGSGMRMKLLLNLLMGIEVQAMAEAAELAAASGLDRKQVLRTIAGSGFASPVMSFKSRRLASGRFEEPDFRLRLMAKDLMLATEQAEASGLSLPLTAAAAETHVRATEHGFGDEDCAAVTRALTRKPGTDK